jgi:hypothetical protein
MTRSWYFYLGEDPLNSDNYYRVKAHNCLCGNRICSIYALGGETHPSAPLSRNLLTYIKNALATQMIQPSIPYDAKKYVYLRDE